MIKTNTNYQNDKDKLFYQDPTFGTLCDGVYNESGLIVNYLKGKVHCEDGPAVICADGEKAWYFCGFLVYDDIDNNISKFTELPEGLKMSIIKHTLITENKVKRKNKYSSFVGISI
jgi:hypothetical protein